MIESSLATVINYSEDALANHFQFVIPVFPGSGNVLEEINSRLKTISIPEQSHEVYDIWANGKKATRPVGVTAMPNEFTATFRESKDFRVHKAFLTWKNRAFNSATGEMSSDAGLNGLGGTSTYRVPLTCLVVDANKVVQNISWVFNGAFVTSVSEVSFDEASGDALETTVTFNFIDMYTLFPN